MPDNDDSKTPYIKIPPYSGVNKDQSYTAVDGTKTETLSIEDYCRRVDTIQSATGWNDDKTAQLVQLSLVPGQPAGHWLDNNFKETWMNKWSTLKPRMLIEFAPFVSVSDKVDIIRSFKQGSNEMVNPYFQRVTKAYNRFTQSFHSEMVAPDAPWDPEGDDAANLPTDDDRNKIVGHVFSYHQKAFFAMGLKDSILSEVTKTGASSLEDMLLVARRAEQAQMQNNRRHLVSAVEAGPSTAPAPPAHASQSQLSTHYAEHTESAVIAALGKWMQRNSGAPSSAGSRKPNITCYYCDNKGHGIRECRKRSGDQRRNIWRRHIKDPPLTKEEYDKSKPTASGNSGKVSGVSATPSAAQSAAAQLEMEKSFASLFSKN